MLLNIFKFYLLGLVIAFFMCLVIGAIWLGWRALRRADKTVKERQGALYDAIMMSMVSIPSFGICFYGDSYRAECIILALLAH